MDLVYESDAYEAFAGVNRGKDIYLSGKEEDRPKFEGNKDNIRVQGT